MNQMRSENSSNIPIAKFRQLSNGPHGHHYATLDTVRNATFRGAGANIGIYNPPVQKYQFSMALIWLVNGPPIQLNTVQVGWAVHPSLYGDNLTRLTTYWTAYGYQKTGCYNAMCPGFVQVDPEVHPGDKLEKCSVIGGCQWAFNFTVKQDKSTGHWWFLISPNTQVGYWPKEIFTHLVHGASSVSYGGTTKAFMGFSPPRGSGLLATTKFARACFFIAMKIVNSMYEEVDINADDMKAYCDTRPDCYTLLYEGYEKRYSMHGHYFTFGGPGGKCDA
ncbi:hypothetical protein L6164_020999 [Bauhinia variegata]|uniref:Uncharacterized protein n=1 Tax=Bauhinia variegata TaxID=167791 RepID=A0ACB9MWT3_BAUVA|nr:hypothetical protein L6164_020999 [Bauhinia variegata]